MDSGSNLLRKPILTFDGTTGTLARVVCEMQRIAYGAILKNLLAVLEFCRSLGLDLGRSRFAVYQQRIEYLDQAIKQAREAGTTPVLKEGVSDLEYIVSLVEATEFGDTLPYLSTCDPSLVRPKLTSVLAGPMLPSDEDQASNQARNLLFELNLATHLSRAGFHPRLGEHPDLLCEVVGKTLFFECKRPFSASKVSKRISQAAKQLRVNLKVAAPGTRGVIAISVSKVLNPGDKLFVTPNELRGRQGLEDALEAVGGKFKKSWIGFSRSNIIGILFHAITPALDQERNMYVVGQQTIGYSLAAPGSLDAKAMDAIGSALEAIQH